MDSDDPNLCPGSDTEAIVYDQNFYCSHCGDYVDIYTVDGHAINHADKRPPLLADSEWIAQCQ